MRVTSRKPRAFGGREKKETYVGIYRRATLLGGLDEATRLETQARGGEFVTNPHPPRAAVGS